MIEKLLKLTSGHDATVATEHYDPKDAVVSRTDSQGCNNELTVLFPPWHGGKRAYDILTARLLRKGDSVMRYVFHDDILHPNPDLVLQSFSTIASEVSEDLHTVADQERYERIKLTAVSLGTPVLAMVATQFSRFDAATLVTPGSKLAPCTWDGGMTQHLRVAYEELGIADAEELDQQWHSIAPLRHIKALETKRIKVVKSLNDVAIPTIYQQEYLTGLEQNGINAEIEYSRLGHYGTIANFCIRGAIQ